VDCRCVRAVKLAKYCEVATRSRLTLVWILLATMAGVVATAFFLFRDREALFLNGLTVPDSPHASIELIAFDERGRRLSSLDFFRTWRPTLIVRNHTGAVCMGIQYGMWLPRLAIPAGEPVTLDLLWPVSGFGKVLLTADNDGKGYRVSAGAFTRIELMPELARSRVGELERWIAHRDKGHPLPDEVAQQLAFARHQLARVDAVHDPRDRAALALPALRAALLAGEQAVMAEASSAIGEHRSGNLLVKVIDPHGTEVPQVKIQIAQTRPEFLFAVDTGNRGYPADVVSRLKQLGLNYASIDLNWAELEPRAGAYAFEQVDHRFNPAALKHDGFTLRARGLTASEASTPAFISALNGNLRELGKAVPAQIGPIVRHYKDLVDVWQLDEGEAAWAGLDLRETGRAEIIKAVADEIRKEAPEARIMINVAAPLGENAAAQYNRALLGLHDGGARENDPYAALQHLSSAHVDYDLIGLDFCCGNNQSQVAPPTVDLFRFARELERWSGLGKPMQVGPLAFGSVGGGNGWWHASPDEGTQAEYLAGATMIAYANPHVQAIMWPALFDRDSQIAGGGLIDRAKRPKAAYDRLSALLKGWRSGGDVTTSSDGLANFQGTPGDYRLTAKTSSESVEGTARIHQNSNDVAVMSTTATVPLPMPSPGAEALKLGGQDSVQFPQNAEPFVLQPPPPVEPPPPPSEQQQLPSDEQEPPPSEQQPPGPIEPPYEPPGP